MEELNYHHLVNLHQSPEERSQKYWLARTHGSNVSLANRCRDWRLSKVERLLGLVPQYDPEHPPLPDN